MSDQSSRAREQATRTVERIASVSPTAVHYAGLAVAAVVLAYLARDQWFFFDDWDFLVPKDGASIFDPHVGHLSTVPIVLYRMLRSIFGLDTYAPYITTVIVAHLGLSHLLWRIACRRAPNRWIPTLLVGVFSVLGAGAENILWGFQVGYVGALLAALGAAYVVDARVLTLTRGIAAGALGLVAVATSGSGLPVVAAAIVLAWYRHGLRKAALVFGPTCIVYALWYLSHRDAIATGYGPKGTGAALTLIPQYVGSSFVDNFGRTLFTPGIAGALVLAVVAFALHRAEALWRLDPMVLLLAGSCALFAVLTATTRSGLGIDQASSPRYTYTVIALLLPIIAMALASVTSWGSTAAVGVSVFLALIGSHNLGMLINQANFQASQEQASRRLVYATLDEWLDDRNGASLGLRPDPAVMPQLQIDGIVELHEHGWLDVGEYGPSEALTAETYVGVDVEPAGDLVTAECETSAGEIAIEPGEPAVVTAPSAGTAQITLTGAGGTGSPRTIDVGSDPIVVRYDGDLQLTLRSDIALTLCGVD